MKDLVDLAGKIVEMARSKGAQQARAGASRTREVGVDWRDGNIEKVSEATTRGAWVDLYVDGRYSSASTSDLRDAALMRFIAESVAMARTLESDSLRSLPDPRFYEGRSAADLQVRDLGHESVTPEQRRHEAAELEAATRDGDHADAIITVTSSVSDSLTQSARAASDGFQGTFERTEFWKGSDVTCRDTEGRKPDDGMYAGARLRADLPTTADVAREARGRALARIGSRKIASARLTMIVEARAAGRLVRALAQPLSGRAIQQRQSFLEGQLGKRVASRLLTVVDDPLLPKGLGSRPYDGDGFAARRRTIIEAGVLRAFFIDDYYGKKLKMAPTTGDAGNLVFSAGDRGLDALAGDAKEAIVVTSFLGGNSNSTTGDYSLGVSGYRVRKGSRAEPIVEMNVAGNQRHLWERLVAVGNDPYPYSSIRTPTLVFDGVTFAGT